MKTSCLPSGLHDGVVTPLSLSWIRSTCLLRATSTMTMSSRRPALGREGQILAVGRPVGLRVDEPIGLVVAADAGLEDPALDLAGDAVGQVQVDEVEVLLAEVGHLRAVGESAGARCRVPSERFLVSSSSATARALARAPISGR